MPYRVVTLRKAEADIRSTVRWLAKRSGQGALSWLAAYDSLVVRLRRTAKQCGMAAEASSVELPVRQAFFSTRHGRTYRAVFVIVGDEVRILRVRGPGQAPLEPDEVI